MTAVSSADLSPPPVRKGFGHAAPGGGKMPLALVAIAIAFLFAFPVLWLLLTSLRPESGVYYVHRGTEFTLHNYLEVIQQANIYKAFWNSFAISTLAVLSLGVTVTSGYMLSRFKGPIGQLVFADLRAALHPLHLVGAAAVLRHPAVGHLRHVWVSCCRTWRCISASSRGS